MRTYIGATFSALSSRDFRLFAAGQAISVSGTWMQKLAQAWLVLTLTNSGFLLGITAAMQQLPTLLLSSFGGALADRFQKRTILITCACAGAVPAIFLAVVVQLDVVQVWMVMAAAMTQGVVDAIEKPTRLTFVNDIADPEKLTNAVALNSIIQDSGKLLGPAIGGLLIAGVGIAPAFMVNAVSYLPVIVALSLIRSRGVETSTGRVKARGNLTGTVRYVRAHPDLSAALGLMAVSGMFAYNWTVLLPILARDTFGGDARAVGFAFTALGLGGVIGGMGLAGLLKATPLRLLAWAGGFALIMVATGLSPTLWWAYVMIFLVGAASVAFRSTATALVQTLTEPHMRGRVIALYVMAMTGTTPIGGPIQGWISEEFSARVGFLVGGVATLSAALLAYRRLAKQRRAGQQLTPLDPHSRQPESRALVEPAPER